MNERELEFLAFIEMQERERDKRPFWEKLASAFSHEIKVFTERFSRIR